MEGPPNRPPHIDMRSRRSSYRVFGLEVAFAGRLQRYFFFSALLGLAVLAIIVAVGSQDVTHSSRYEPAFIAAAIWMIVSGLAYAVLAYALAIASSAHREETGRHKPTHSRSRAISIGLGLVVVVANGTIILLNGHLSILQLALAALVFVALWLVNRRWPQR